MEFPDAKQLLVHERVLQEEEEQEQDLNEEETNSNVKSQNTIYAEGLSSIYNGYQQAWRMLGFFVDCTSSEEIEQDGNNNNHNNKNGNYQMNTCQRYLLWAAYVDEEYEGGGIGEYSFLVDGEYNSTYSCDVHGNGRCVPMDCHESKSSTWKLLGVYKEAFYASEWFEQLFKHAGYCLWDYNDYSFMHTYYASWPEGCKSTKTMTAPDDYGGKTLYFDLRPTLGGYMSYGLYTDNICRTEFVDTTEEQTYTTQLQQVLSQYGYLSGSQLEAWNMHMNVYKFCQPCRASNLYYNPNNNNNKNNQHRRRNNNQEETGRTLEDNDYDPNDGYFACYDDAGYTNVNQCMKFRTHTYMQSATIQDIQMAHQQGGILEITLNGHTYGMSLDTITEDGTYPDQSLSSSSVLRTTEQQNAIQSIEAEMPLFISSIIIVTIGFLALIVAIRWKINRVNARYRFHSLEEPLVDWAGDADKKTTNTKKTKTQSKSKKSRGVLT